MSSNLKDNSFFLYYLKAAKASNEEWRKWCMEGDENVTLRQRRREVEREVKACLLGDNETLEETL